jgi:predicted DNA-binding helix-hairpin-helix protein
MEALQRLQMLSGQMEMEPAEDHGCSDLSHGKQESIVVYPAHLPGGGRIRLLKTLLSSVCENDCNYCPFRAGRDFHRVSFQPGEFANLFMRLQMSGLVDGLFLSSGIFGSGVFTQDRLIDTVEILRKKLGFYGYIHLKVMPGADHDQVFRAMQLADRISINLEGPNPRRLAILAPKKQFIEQLLTPMGWVEGIRQKMPGRLGWKHHWPGTTTQFVVGAAGESDLELLSTTQHLMANYRLIRAYYSAFNPHRDTPLEHHAATPPVREHRLYEAFYLMRDYGFDLEEIPFAQNENLPLDTDPKLAWAQRNIKESPIEINSAERTQLLRIPGFGPRAVEQIIAVRRIHPITDPSHLVKLGIRLNRAAPFVLLRGKKPVYQPNLFG